MLENRRSTPHQLRSVSRKPVDRLFNRSFQRENDRTVRQVRRFLSGRLSKEHRPRRANDEGQSSREVSNPLISRAFLQDPFNEHRGAFQFSSILTRLEKLKVTLKSNEQLDQINPQPNRSLDALIAYYPDSSNSEAMDIETDFDYFDEPETIIDQQDEIDAIEDFP